MVAGVPGQRGVVALNVELELVLEAVCAQEVHCRGRVPIILVLGWLLPTLTDVCNSNGLGMLIKPK